MKKNPKRGPSVDELKARLAEVDRLIADGTLKGDAARQRRDELERQVLAAVGADAQGVPGTATGDATARPSGRLVAGIAGFVLVFGLAGWGVLGSRDGLRVGPGEPGPAAAAGPEAGPTAAQIEAMVAKLAERLKTTTPDDAEGWAMLARAYGVMGRHADALPAFKRVVELRPDNAQALADYADGLAMVNQQSLEGEPEKLVQQALKLDPNNVKALMLAGTVAYNRNDFAGAVGLWERAQKGTDPASDFARQLQGAVADARQRAGMPPAAGAAPATGPLAAAGPAAAGSAAGAGPGAPSDAGAPAAGAANAFVAGRVTLAAAAKGKVSPDDTVFIFARPASGARMPLAILRRKVSDLPLDFKLDDSLAMSPAARISSQAQVIVGARISKSGNAMPQPGDLQALTAPVAVGTQGLKLDIADAVP